MTSCMIIGKECCDHPWSILLRPVLGVYPIQFRCSINLSGENVPNRDATAMNGYNSVSGCLASLVSMNIVTYRLL